MEEQIKVIFKKNLEGILGELQSCDLQTYFGKSLDLMDNLRKADDEK